MLVRRKNKKDRSTKKMNLEEKLNFENKPLSNAAS